MNFDWWTDEKLAALKDMFQSGASFAEIGRTIGTTRSAVAGKVTRLGLGRRISAEQMKAKRSDAGRKRAAHRYQKPSWFADENSRTVAPPPGRYAGANGGGARPATAPPQPPAPDPVAPVGGITFLEVRDGLCRWSITKETTFDHYRACGCACSVTERYCVEHKKKSIAPREPKQRANDERPARNAERYFARVFA